ncbi:MAG: transcription-repair coupling factor, partial [Bacteroidales bacterium]|nr:transcription-repair coupling factor [Bacteroidales bacterium]
ALSDLLLLYRHHPHYRKLLSTGNRHVCLSGLAGSSASLVAASVISARALTYLVILPEKEEAAYFYNDLINLLGSEQVYFFPSSSKRSLHYDQIDPGNIILRTKTLDRIGQEKSEGDKRTVVITYPDGLSEKVITHKKLKKNTLQLNVGEKVSPAFIQEVLEEYKFSQSDFVYEPGHYSVRGSIIDIFSFSSPYPYRIDFFGDEVESIRSFNADDQLSKENHKSINIIPNIHDLTLRDVSESFLDYLPSDSLIWVHDIAYTAEKLNEIYHHAMQKKDMERDLLNGDQLTTGHYLIQQLDRFRVVEVSHHPFYPGAGLLSFSTTPQPSFNKNFNLVAETFLHNQENGFVNFILSDSEKQIDRLTAIFHDINPLLSFRPLHQTLHGGFVDQDIRICCFTDHQIFERYHKYTLDAYFSDKGAFTLKELKGLQPGDYVVHIDHGIGKFGGLEKININGRMQEAVRLVYQDQDILYVSIHSLHKISKYKGREEGPPRLYKLGSGAWQRLKQSTKRKIQDIARDLIALYAKRRMIKGMAFSPDTYLQYELEASFIFEDTPDQEKASRAVKEDMESEVPMDRLICGDVGFGKTEVAVRASFKAVADNKQVAVLVPTTILALQHYNTFSERLKDFPCHVDHISRLRKPKDQKITLENLGKGKVDIIIGTHRLLGSDVHFKDLGLLILDEEQKFGVAAKEKLKRLKLNVDTLTLTATPIPRTLQFSLMGARDLSVINTPPPNRHPIVTELHTFNEDIIKEGILYEVSRGGQVFFIHNRIQNIVEIQSLVQRLCPGVRTIVAHGQMEGQKLEKTMLDFIRGDYDVLVSTTIIESGLDIPNANTIFINNAHHFGLSDLHQLRGRVGRSNKKAFCYLLAPPLHLMTPEARRRVKAIEEFSDLGSGFNIALQDLDIRGAGNLLGAEQSGFIADIGFETYTRILNEAIQELKEKEYKAVFETEKEHKPASSYYLKDCQIDTDLELLFPDFYISNVAERMDLYRQLDQIENENALASFENQLKDRFGPLPPESVELIEVVRLRWLAVSLGFEKLLLKGRKMIGYFISDPDSDFYKSLVFGTILTVIQKDHRQFRMKEGNNRLILTIDNIETVYEAKDKLLLLKG